MSVKKCLFCNGELHKGVLTEYNWNLKKYCDKDCKYNFKYPKKGWNPNSIGSRFEKGMVGDKCVNWSGGSEKYHRELARNIFSNFFDTSFRKGQVIHHIDGNYENNDIENLHLFDSQSEHITYHNMLKKIIKKEIRGEF